MSQSTNDKAQEAEMHQDREAQNPEVQDREAQDREAQDREAQDREAQDRAHAGHAYRIPDPGEMETCDKLSGLPWGSLPLKYIISRGKRTPTTSKNIKRETGALGEKEKEE